MRKPNKFSLVLIIVMIIAGSLNYWLNAANRQPPIRIGLLTSQTGTMADSETPIINAVQLAVEEINTGGGLLNRPLELIIANGASDPDIFSAQAEHLLGTTKVQALFGCWTSSSRKAIKPLVEKYDNLLFYPLQYEGLEHSPNIIYAGAAANQQIIPGSIWAMQKFGKRVFLLGSDYVFPRTANRILRDVIQYQQAELLAERYQPLAGQDFSQVIAEIRRLRPDLILSTINGDSNRYFLQALAGAGLNDVPLLSFSIAETELQALDAGKFSAHYLVWGYFQNLPGQANNRFLTAFRQRFGPALGISDPMEAAYVSVKLWAQAVRESGTSNAHDLQLALLHQTFNAPSGILSIDSKTRHLWKPVRIGQIMPDNNVRIVTTLSEMLKAIPFPEFHSKAEWEAILDKINNDLQP